MDQKIKERLILIGGGKGTMFCAQSIHHGSGPPLHHQILPARMGDPGIHLMLAIASKWIRGYLTGALNLVVGERLDLLERFRKVAIESLYQVSLKPVYRHQTFPNLPVSEILLDMDMVVCENLLVREKFVDLIRSSSCMQVFMEDYLHDVLVLDGDQPLLDRQAAARLLGSARSFELQQQFQRDWLDALSAPILCSDDVDEITSEGDYLLEGDLKILSMDLDRIELVKQFAALFYVRFIQRNPVSQEFIKEFNSLFVKLDELYQAYFPSRSWDADVNSEVAQLELQQQGGADM